ncbi:hypothetical protein [Desulfolucanica intricata]|uniref:hypothetical protein n=1 Tax=Desulfolucanica intricata TaxID=1285191 RepID=UPI0008316E7D|nr:hypothetical protein [Desulfolucanica intricata]
MNKTGIFKQYPNFNLPADKYRQTVINKVTAKLLSDRLTEKEALSMFLWKLIDIEPPVSYDEQLVFCALYRMFSSYNSVMIKNREQALKILNIDEDKRDLPQVELLKEAKLAYWEQFNTLTQSASDFALNAHEIGIKKKAFIFLSENIENHAANGSFFT